MKKIARIGVWMMSLALISGGEAWGQSLKDILNSSTVKDVISSTTGITTPLNAKNLAGQWNYVSPAVQLEGDNALKNATGSLAAGELEKKLADMCEKVGIKAGAFSMTFQEDNSFVMTLKSKDLKGTYSVDSEAKTITLDFASGKDFSFTKMNAQVSLLDNELNLLFQADKLLDLLSKLSAWSNNTTLKAANSLLEQYDGIKLGFAFKR